MFAIASLSVCVSPGLSFVAALSVVDDEVEVAAEVGVYPDFRFCEYSYYCCVSVMV